MILLLSGIYNRPARRRPAATYKPLLSHRRLCCEGTVQQLIRTLEGRLSEPEAARNASRSGQVFSEEWNDPLISGIGWVSELVERSPVTDSAIPILVRCSLWGDCATADQGNSDRRRLCHSLRSSPVPC
jgi:hypothetical protein